MKKIIICSLACLASLTLAGSASATLLDFTPANLGVAGSNPYDSVGMSVDGISVNITAYTIKNDGHGTIFSTSQITGSDAGVYVSNSDNLGVEVNPPGVTDSHNMDGGSSHKPFDPDEGLLFSFNQTIRLDYINFDRFGHSDDFNLTVDGVFKLADFDGHSTSPLSSQVPGQQDEYTFSNIVGQNFLFWADANSDSFRIDRMIVRAFGIPEPTSLLLLGVGLVGFYFTRRKPV